jgi:Mrp family chromosome partitioning ATPase
MVLKRVILFVPRCISLAREVIMFLPRIFVGSRRYTMPRDFCRSKILSRKDTASPPRTSGFDAIHSLLEQYRKLYMNVIDSVAPRGSIAICSPNKGDGRSTIAANLAVVMALDMKRKITIVDLDVRNHALPDLLGAECGRGICDIGPEESAVDFLVPTRTPGLTLLPAGTIPDNPIRFFNSGIIEKAILDLEEQGHFVIVDTPPAIRFVDTKIIAGDTGGVLTVIKLGITKRFQMASYYRKMEGSRFSGVVCNYDEYWIPAWMYKFV